MPGPTMMNETETKRLAALARLAPRELGSPPELLALARATALLCGCPNAELVIVESDQLYALASTFRTSPAIGCARDISFCAHTILGDEVFYVADARKDERFSNNPLVLAPEGVRFYVGAPLILENGERVGALCSFGPDPIELTSDSLSTLAFLAQSASKHLESLRDKNELERQRQRLDDIISGTGAGTWSWEIATGRLDVNEQWARLLGYELSELSELDALGWASLVHPEDLPGAQSNLVACLSGRAPKYRFELRMATKNGRWKWILADGQVKSRDQSGRASTMFGTHLDIEERKRAQSELSESAQKHRAIYENTPALLFSVDPSGQLLNFTDLFAKSLGFERKDLEKCQLADLLIPDSAARFEVEFLPALLREGEPSNTRLAFSRGNARPLEATIAARTERDHAGNLLQISASATDATELSAALSELVNERARLSRIIDGTQAGTWEHNLSTGEDRINDIYARMLGYEHSELAPIVAADFASIIHPDDREQALSAWTRHIHNSEVEYSNEFRARHKDGRWIWLLSRGKASLRDADGRALAISGIHLDITERYLT